MDSIKDTARKVVDLYVDGFRNMTVGRKLWAIILIKAALLFLVFKLFFFPDLLKENYDNDDDRARAVAEQLTTR
ncbi:MAG: DUF4492 domain-containing protein [Muribaculaceae bacterium]|nr:DUF4492 domain-containing protein [Muribaculaceae bacterium]